MVESVFRAENSRGTESCFTEIAFNRDASELLEYCDISIGQVDLWNRNDAKTGRSVAYHDVIDHVCITPDPMVVNMDPATRVDNFVRRYSSSSFAPARKGRPYGKVMKAAMYINKEPGTDPSSSPVETTSPTSGEINMDILKQIAEACGITVTDQTEETLMTEILDFVAGKNPEEQVAEIVDKTIEAVADLVPEGVETDVEAVAAEVKAEVVEEVVKSVPRKTRKSKLTDRERELVLENVNLRIENLFASNKVTAAEMNQLMKEAKVTKSVQRFEGKLDALAARSAVVLDGTVTGKQTPVKEEFDPFARVRTRFEKK